jgi:metal-dependent HD superfamily phosphatase/phosphodiesterase
MITFEELAKNKEVQYLIKKADEYLLALGYTDHGFNHIQNVTQRARMISEKIGFSKEKVDLTCIASYMHDIGNITGRENHSLAGSLLAFQILRGLSMDIDSICQIVTAIASHDEYSGDVTDEISAVLIIADKSDVRRSRVREKDVLVFDIHDRVNYAVEKSEVIVIEGNKELWINLKIDTVASPVMDYFEIFLNRMILCKKAAKKLNHAFHLKINDSVLY